MRATMTTPAPASYHPLSVVSHWLVAVLALVCMLSILLATQVGRLSTWHATLMNAHLISGQLLFLVNLLRLLVFSAFGTPEPEGCDGQQVLVARVLHALLYGLVGFLACTGTLLMAAHAAGYQVLGWTVPLLMTGGAMQLTSQVHVMAGMALVFVSLAHILLALAMQLLGGKPVMQKMAVEGKLADYVSAPVESDGYARLDLADTGSLGNTR